MENKKNDFVSLLNNKTLQRVLEFSIYKLLVGVVLYWGIIIITNLSFTKIFLELSFEFHLADYIKLYLLSIVLDVSRIAVFQRYDFPNSALSQLAKIVFEPNIQTLYIFVSFKITYLMIAILDYNDTKKENMNTIIIIYS
jgi:hypothetical protein